MVNVSWGGSGSDEAVVAIVYVKQVRPSIRCIAIFERVDDGPEETLDYSNMPTLTLAYNNDRMTIANQASASGQWLVRRISIETVTVRRKRGEGKEGKRRRRRRGGQKWSWANRLA